MPRRGEFGIGAMIALACLAPLSAKDPPPDLAKRVAHRESETADERRQYAYTQSVRLQELDGHGVQAARMATQCPCGAGAQNGVDML